MVSIFPHVLEHKSNCLNRLPQTHLVRHDTALDFALLLFQLDTDVNEGFFGQRDSHLTIQATPIS